MKIRVEVDCEELKRMVVAHIANTLGDIRVNSSNVQIMVKSKQNYKSEWAPAEFKAVYENGGGK